MQINLDSRLDADPDYLLQVTEAFAETVRIANHLTRSPEALAEPEVAAAVLRDLTRGVSRLPQLASQIAARMESEHQARGIRVSEGPHAGQPDVAVIAFTNALDEAAAHAERLELSFRIAAREAARMRISGDG
jgi:hypothetical protein